MAVSIIALVVALASLVCGTASAGKRDAPAPRGYVGLPLLNVLPSNCGYVLGVLEGDTCDSLAAYGGIDRAKYDTLNPLALCDFITPAPGSAVCVGDTLSFCSDSHRTAKGDTCSSIKGKQGAIIGGNVDCPDPKPDTPVCVRPGANQCDVDSLCGVRLSADMRELLGMTPDWCTILRECKAPLKATTTNGLPSLTATLTEITPGVTQVADNDGHPELGDFVNQRTAGPASLQIAFVPNARGDGAHASNFVMSSGGSGRKLLATAARAGQPGYAAPRYY